MQNQTASAADVAALVAQHADAAAAMNRDKMDYQSVPGDGSHFLIATYGGVYLSNDSIYPAVIARIADSWIDAPRVSLEKPAQPEAVALFPDVPQESNAVVMARAVAVVRDRRLAAEYVAAKDGDDSPDLDDGDDWTERDPMPGDPCDCCGVQLESGQTGLCEDCAPPMSDDEENARALDAEQARADAARKLAGE